MKSFPRIACVLIVLLSAISLRGQSHDVINPEKLQAAVHVGKMMRTQQQGDTLVHNAAAYQVMQGADSESLLSKMPGISVSESGVEAGGKDVKRILLDGQEFFGNDVLTALRTVPVDMVRQIEVINRLSDNARMTGVDDGEGYMAINIVTKRKAGDAMVSGRAYANYGFPDHYIAGGNISRFADDKTLNIIGMSNNISKFNFTTSDILSGASGLNEGAGKDFKVKALAGISAVHSLGANYSSKSSNLSYFFNIIDNENSQKSEKNTMTAIADRLQSVLGSSNAWSGSMTHRFSGKIDFSPSKKHSFVIRPDFMFEDLSNKRDSYSLYRYLYSDASTKYINNQLNATTQDRWHVRAGTSLNYRYAFDKRRRSLSLYARYAFYGLKGVNSSCQYKFRNEDTDYDIAGEDLYSTSIQSRDNSTLQHSGIAKVTFTEPLNRRSVISTDYTFNIVSTGLDNMVDVLNGKTGEYERSDRMSARSVSTFLNNRLGGRYSYGFKKKNVVLSATYQHTGFFGDVTLPSEGLSRKNYHHVLYQVTVNLPFNKANTLKIEAKGKTQNPQTSMLQDVVNMSSTSNVRAGNPDLDLAYMHEAELQYRHTDSRHGSTFTVTATYTGSPNYFCDSLVINTPDFEVMEGVKLGENNQYVKPINLPGYHNLYLRVGYGIPISLIRCNFNVNATMSLKQLPSMVNGTFVPIHTDWYQLEGRLHSNISKDLDFMVGYNARYSANEYSGKYGVVRNNYFLHRVMAKFKWVFLQGFTFTGAAHYKRYVSTEGLFDDQMLLCDLFVGRKFLRSRNLEVSVGVNDLFNDNVKSYWHTVNASGTNDGENIGLGRYYSVQCIWHIRSRSAR